MRFCCDLFGPRCQSQSLISPLADAEAGKAQLDDLLRTPPLQPLRHELQPGDTTPGEARALDIGCRGYGRNWTGGLPKVGGGLGRV